MAQYIVSSGVTITGIALNYDSMYVQSGGVANSTTVNSYGHLYVSSGGTANSTTVNSWGYLIVSNGGTADSTTINVGGNLHVSNGGTANSTTVNVGGDFDVSSGGTANSTNVNNRGSMYVSNGGTANSTTVNSGGNLIVSNGGTANSVTVNGGGDLYVHGGGTALAIQENGGYVSVDSNANVSFLSNSFSGLVLSDRSSATLHSGTTANSTTVNSWGALHVSSGGTANSTTVNSWGYIIVSNGGTANSTTVNNGGDLRVSSGGTALAIKENGGYVEFSSDANVSFIANTLSGLVLEHDATLHSGTIANSTTVNGGHLTVFSGGSTNNTTIISWGNLHVSCGGTANSTTVNSSGYMYVSSGGTATGTTVNSSGYMYISCGGAAIDITVYSCGGMTVFNGGSVNDITVNDGGRMTVFNGGTADNITVNSNAVLYTDNWSNGGGAINDTTISGGTVFVASSGTANATAVDTGKIVIYNGGTADNTIVSSGIMVVSSGATATETTIRSGGELVLENAGSASSLTLCAGGILNRFSFGEAFLISNACGSAISLSEGLTITETSLHVTGQDIVDIVVYDGAKMVLFNGGTATGTTVHSSGEIALENTARASNLTLYAGGIINRFSFDEELSIVDVQGASISVPGNLIIAGNSMLVSQGKKAENFTVHSGGSITLAGEAENLRIKTGARLNSFEFGEDLTVSQDSSGIIQLSEGVTIAGSTLTIIDGGTLSGGVELYDNAALHIASGATLSGFLHNQSASCYENPNVTIETGAKIDLCLSDCASGALISNVSSAELSNAEISIIVPDWCEVGSYTICDDISAFYGKDISVKDTCGNLLGTLSLNNTSYIVGGSYDRGYKLSSNYYGLTLDVLGRIEVNGACASGTYNGIWNGIYTSEGGSCWYELPSGYNVYCYSGGYSSYVGTYPTEAYCYIQDASGMDITQSCYDAGLVSTHEGYITVTPAYCSINLLPYTKVYDGQPLDAYFVQENLLSCSGLCEGDEVFVESVDYCADAGYYNYSINVSIKNGGYSGIDVTECYGGSRGWMSVWGGVLEITPIEITLTSEDASKQYDETPLTCSYVSQEGYCIGYDSIYCEATGSQTEVGSSANTITYSLNCSNPNNYRVITQEGTLTVEPRGPITVTAASDVKTYDGTALTNSGYSFTEGVLLDGDELIVTVEGSITDAGSAVNRVSSCKVMRGEIDVTANYNFNAFVDGELTITRRNIHLQTESASKVYDGTPLQEDNISISGDGFVKGQGANFTTASLLCAGKIDNSVTSIKYRSGTKAENYEISYECGTLEVTPCAETITVTADSVSKVYDGTALTAGYSFTGSLMQGDTLDVTVEGSITDTGTVANRITGVRIMHGETDVTASYAGIQCVDGVLEITKRTAPVTITASSASRKYDGTALTAGYTHTGTLAETDELVVTLSGSITDAGSAVNKVTAYKVMRGSVDATANYTFNNSVDGTLSVTPRSVVMASADALKSYDGTPLVNNTVTVFGDGWVEGEGASYTVTGSQQEVGSSPNTFSYALNDNTKAENYAITTEEGTLTVTPYSGIITITADSAAKMYDGKALTAGYSYTGSVADGDTLVVTLEGTITGAGTAVNAITGYKVMRGDADVTKNYQFGAITDGLLTVTPRDVTITSSDDWMVYDGTALTNHTISFSGSGFLAGEGVSRTFTGTQTEIGTSLNSFTYTPKGETDLGNYNIISRYGALTVLPDAESIVIIASSAEKNYDGSALTADYSYAGNLLDGDELEVTVSGSITNAGSVVSQITDYRVMRGGEDVTASYNISTVNGKLTVKGPVTAKSDLDGNGVSDVMFQWTGGDYQIGFWMNGTSTWQGTAASQPGNWELLGNYDMDANGNADQVMFGNVVVNDVKGAYIGYYKDGDTTSNGWVTIGYLDNSEEIEWHNVIGNLTGNEGKNSIVWHAPELGACGVWTDGTTDWVGISGYFDSNWEMQGCGDFDGNGKDEILWKYNGELYTTGINSNFASLGNASGWEVRAIGDFSGDGKDDIVLFHSETGSVMKYENGQASQWSSLGQLAKDDWFIVGAGDYNGDAEDDLLVRQYSSGMLGYYESSDMSKWVEMGRGVDMNWTVIA